MEGVGEVVKFDARKFWHLDNVEHLEFAIRIQGFLAFLLAYVAVVVFHCAGHFFLPGWIFRECIKVVPKRRCFRFREPGRRSRW